MIWFLWKRWYYELLLFVEVLIDSFPCASNPSLREHEMKAVRRGCVLGKWQHLLKAAYILDTFPLACWPPAQGVPGAVGRPRRALGPQPSWFVHGMGVECVDVE